MTNIKLKFGEKLNQEFFGIKDAVHSPVVAAKSVAFFKAGEFAYLDDNNNLWNDSAKDRIKVVVDPFFESSIEEGDVVLVMVNPKDVTDVRHVWKSFKFELKENPQAALVQSIADSMENDDDDDWCKDCRYD